IVSAHHSGTGFEERTLIAFVTVSLAQACRDVPLCTGKAEISTIVHIAPVIAPVAPDRKRNITGITTGVHPAAMVLQLQLIRLDCHAPDNLEGRSSDAHHNILAPSTIG